MSRLGSQLYMASGDRDHTSASGYSDPRFSRLEHADTLPLFTDLDDWGTITTSIVERVSSAGEPAPTPVTRNKWNAVFFPLTEIGESLEAPPAAMSSLLSVLHRLSARSWTSSNGGLTVSIDEQPHPEPPTATRVRNLKSDTGLTWDQVSKLFGVSP